MSARRSPSTRELARRLAEAEATIKALLSRQADAVVDGPAPTPLVPPTTHDALRDSEARYRRIVETTNEGIATIDGQSTLTFVNARFAAMLGYESGEMPGLSWLQFLPDTAEARAASQRRIARRRDGLADENEVGLVRRDGSELWAVLRTCTIRDGAGTPAGTLIMVTDRTGRKRAEEALREQEDRAQRYLDTAAVILLALDTEARVTLVNRYACELLGWTSEELLGLDWIETCLPARNREVMRGVFQGLVGGNLSVVETPILTRSGETRLIEWRNTRLLDGAGRITGTFSSGTDITDRNQATEALRTTDERMRFALDAAGVGIWDMDYTTGELRWSEILEAQHGIPPGTFAGTFEAFVERVHPDDRLSVLETLMQAVMTGADFTTEHRSLWADGTVRWLSGAGRIHLAAHGEPVRGVGISQDVTERRSLEEHYRQAQKMEAIGQLAGGVAHDFNNLLTVILGHCELLQADFDPDDARLPDIAEIHNAGVRGAGLTRQLLAFSRKQIIEPALLDLNVVVAEMRPMLARLIGEDVTIVLSLRPRLAPVMADRGQVEQIILNLAVNARDAMAQGGTLTIAVANVDRGQVSPKAPAAEPLGPHVTLTVTDTGAGMTPQVQARLFEPFFTTKAVGKGTGLGLATVQGIVLRSGGTLNVESEVGRGTSFMVYFPRAAAGEVVLESPPAHAASQPGVQTVLLVEDESALRELATRLLERQGYTVLAAANADDALQLFAGTPSIDLLLTDVVMPGSSGPELTRRLVEQRPSLKVIYMSGYTGEAIVHHGVLDPGVAFLHKPFTSDALRRKIRDVLDGQVAGTVVPRP